MCRPTPCTACGKTTWSGCGQHIEQVKATVPPQQWCTCTPAQRPEPTRRGFLASLFSR